MLNKASNSLEIEEDNISSSIEVNDEISVDPDTHLTEQPEVDNNPEDEEPAGIFFCILKVYCSNYGVPCVATVKVKEVGGNYERRGRTVLLGRTFFFGLKQGHKYRITIEDTGDSREVILSSFFESESFCLE